MNRELFRSMGEQMAPSEGAQAALREKLTAAPVKRPAPWRKYAAVAACAAVILASVPIYNAARPHDAPSAESVRLHSYTLAEGGIWARNEMSAQEAAPAPEPAPVPQPDAGGGETDNDQIDWENANRLSNIFASFRNKEGRMPDWYGGRYVVSDTPDHVARLTVVLVKELDTPELRQWIYDRLPNDQLDFVTGNYSFNHLLDLQQQILDSPAIREVLTSSATNEKCNCLDLFLTGYSDAALAALSELDPADDAIRVTVYDAGAAAEDHAAIPDRGQVGAAASKAPQILRPGDDGYVEPSPTPATTGPVFTPAYDPAVGYIAPSGASACAPDEEFPLEEVEKVSAQKVALVDLEEVEKISAQKVAPVDLEEIEKVSAQKVAPVDLEEVEKVSAQKVAPAGALEGASPAYDPDEAKFPAVVLEVSGDSVLMECTAADGGLRAGDQVTFSWTDTALAPGDRVIVVFDGGIMETWPAQLGSVVSVTVVQP